MKCDYKKKEKTEKFPEVYTKFMEYSMLYCVSV